MSYNDMRHQVNGCMPSLKTVRRARGRPYWLNTNNSLLCRYLQNKIARKSVGPCQRRYNDRATFRPVHLLTSYLRAEYFGADMDSVSLSTVLSIHPDVVWRDVDGEIVLLNLATGEYFGLDGAASRIWQLLDDTGVSVMALCDALSTEFEVDRATVDIDVTALVADLVSHQLVSVQA